MASVCDKKHPVSFFLRDLLVDKPCFQFLTSPPIIDHEIIAALPCPYAKTAFNYIIINPFRVTFLRDFFCLQNVSVFHKTQFQLSGGVWLRRRFSRFRPALCLPYDLYPVICPLRRNASRQIDLFSHLPVKQFRNRLKVGRRQIFLSSAHFTDTFLQKQFSHCRKTLKKALFFYDKFYRRFLLFLVLFSHADAGFPQLPHAVIEIFTYFFRLTG